jgi:hypothetical protein
MEVFFLHLLGQLQVGGRVAFLGCAQQPGQAHRRQALGRMPGQHLAHAGHGRAGFLILEPVHFHRPAQVIVQRRHQ